MGEAALASPISVISATKPGPSHAGLSLCAVWEPVRGGAKGGKMLTLSIGGFQREGWECEPDPSAGSRRTFPTHTRWLQPGHCGCVRFDLSTKVLKVLGKFGFWEVKAPGTSLCASSPHTKQTPKQPNPC